MTQLLCPMVCLEMFFCNAPRLPQRESFTISYKMPSATHINVWHLTRGLDKEMGMSGTGA